MTKLIELGGDPACRDNDGRSCLHLAANNDSASAVRILLQYKVSELSQLFSTFVTINCHDIMTS